MTKYIIATTIFLFVFLGGTGLFLKQPDRDERVECLHDEDCRQRLQAAINEIYDRAGYSTQ